MIKSSVLIIHQGALGDFILTFPAIIQLKKQFKRIDVLCHNQKGKLAGALDLVDNGFPAEASSFSSLYTEHVNPEIGALLIRYEKIILFTISKQLEKAIRSVTTSFVCQIPPKPPVHQRTHVSRFVLGKIYDCGLIAVAEAEFDNIHLADCRGPQRDRNKILLHPGAGSIRKRWPLENFLQVAAELIGAGLKPEFILGPAEEGLVQELKHSDLIVHIVDDLIELLDIFNSAGGYIGNDSGASHLAAFSGLPTTVIFGPADPERWTPVGPKVKVVRPATDCLPCFETEKDNCDAHNCLEDISPKMVIDAFFRLSAHNGSKH